MPVTVDLRTDLPNDRREIALLRTPRREVGRDRLSGLARSFRVRGEPRDVGYGYVVEDRRSTLEVFAASDSVRWIRAEVAADETQERMEPLDESTARGIAETFLEERGLLDRERARVSSIRPNEVVRHVEGEGEESFATAVQVNFRYEVDGLPLLGPGAKAQVNIGAREQVNEAYRFWREPASEESRPLIPADRAVEMLVRDPAFAELEDGRARIVVDEVRLGHYALPPREVQGYLIPAYEVRATLSTPELERYPFVRYVVAVEYEPDEVKRLGIAGRASGPVF